MTLESTGLEKIASHFTEAKRQLSYHDFVSMVAGLAVEGKVTGHQQSMKLLQKSLVNLQLMRKLDQELVLCDSLKKSLSEINRACNWFVLMEGWCHDGAQNVPLLAAAAQCSPFIELSLILRDENPEIMNKYLTHGTRGIPKLVCVDCATEMELGSWGPRPTEIQNKVIAFKREHLLAGRDEFSRNLKMWYDQDQGRSLQRELEVLVQVCNERAKSL